MFQLEYFERRTQVLEPPFHDAAQFYLGRVATFFHRHQHQSSCPAIVSMTRLPEDWEEAEFLNVLNWC